MIHFACPKCSFKYKTPPEHAWKKFACRGCKTQLEVPGPELLPEEEQVEELDEVLEEVDELDELPEVLPVETKRKRKRRKPSLIVYGTNGSVELVGQDLVFRHSGSFGFLMPSIRSGTFRHNVLGLTDIEFHQAGLLGEGRIRFVFGWERLDPEVEYVLDNQTILFTAASNMEFLQFKKEVWRYKRKLQEEIPML